LLPGEESVWSKGLVISLEGRLEHFSPQLGRMNWRASKHGSEAGRPETRIRRARKRVEKARRRSFPSTTSRLPAKKEEKSPIPLAFSVVFVYKARAETLLFPRCHRAVSAALCVFWIRAGRVTRDVAIGRAISGCLEAACQDLSL